MPSMTGKQLNVSVPLLWMKHELVLKEFILKVCVCVLVCVFVCVCLCARVCVCVGGG